MVFVYIDILPQQIKQKLNYAPNPADPSNYISFSELKILVKDYNADRVEDDHLLLHKIVGNNFIMDSDLQVLKRKWEDDNRPEEILKAIKEREIRSQNRVFLSRSSQLTKGMFPKPTEHVKDYEKSVNFGLSFIFSIFASALLGYYLGIYFLQWSQEQSYFLAILFLMGALLLETSLYIVKIMKEDKIKEMRNKQEVRKAKVKVTQAGKQKKD